MVAKRPQQILHRPECAQDCTQSLMQEYSTTDLANICNDVAQQRDQSLFLCIFSSCQSRYYGPALASAILSCSGRGANINPLLPVEIQSEKLFSRQTSQDSTVSSSPDSDNIHDFVIDHKLTLALDCNAGSDGVVTVSLSSPTTFATHIPQSAGFPGGQLGPSVSDSSETTAGPTVTQLQGRPPLPSGDDGSLTASDDHVPGQRGQDGQVGQDGSSATHETDSDCETTSASTSTATSSVSSTRCGCIEETESVSRSISACQPTVQQVSTHATATTTSVQSTTATSCNESSEAVPRASSQVSSSSTPSTSSTSGTSSASGTRPTSSTSTSSKVSSTSTSPSASKDSPCEASESTTKQAPKITTTSTSCSADGSYGGDVHLPKLPAQKTFSNSTATEKPASTLTSASGANTASTFSCDTTLSASTASSSSSSVASTISSSIASSGTSATTSTVIVSSSRTVGSSDEADDACSTSSLSKSTQTSSSSTTLTTASHTHADSQLDTPPAYTIEDLPQAYDALTSMPLPSYVDAAPPEYSAAKSVAAASASHLTSSKSSVSSTSSLSTSTTIYASVSSYSSTATTESMPSYGYDFDAAGATAKSTSLASPLKSRPSQTASDEEHPSNAASFLSSDPGQDVENTASSESKSHIPGIETVPPPSESSATTTLQPAVTTQALPIGGGPPVLFVTIIEPDSNGTLETSVLTVSEKSPWQTPMPEVEDLGDRTLRARVDGYRLGMASDPLTQDSNGPTTTTSSVNFNNNTSTLARATSNATEKSADVLQKIAPTSLPVVSGGSELSYYMANFVVLILGWIVGKRIVAQMARWCR
ncbi:hypothetical protein LLEC1_04863 [Akanthomyces lecanii]|uniref:Extracellular membrane protein CFEM domain-containing protein n=1 Tax=Cordyceps confragosa TaxID=2714763 RepID=A0A179I961_CORDF|nr:hypothetical protein LLEC1_04863 [Akanthomyces lecanii]